MDKKDEKNFDEWMKIKSVLQIVKEGFGKLYY